MKNLITRDIAVHLKKSIFAIAILFLGGVLSSVTPQSPRSLRAKLVGTWRFVSASQRMADGTVRPDPQTGPRGRGYIIYTETGQMCAMIANPDRPKWKSEAAPQEDELRSALQAWLRTAGLTKSTKQRNMLFITSSLIKFRIGLARIASDTFRLQGTV
jgi:hypothetical protein